MTQRPCDLVIIGCGPAGIAASIWANDLKLRAVTLETERRTGGQLHRVFNEIANYPGVESGDGAELAVKLSASMNARSFDLRLFSSATLVDVESRAVVVASEKIETQFILLATGVRPRKLSVPGVEKFGGVGVHGSATEVADEYVGARVVVVGGGDAALEEALILARVCDEVTIVHRGATFSGRADFRRRVGANARINAFMSSRLLAIDGTDRVERASVATPDGVAEIRTDAVFPCLGVEPNNDLVRSIVSLDEKGFVRTDDRQRTSVDWIYAAGDVCAHSSLTIASAVGQGAAAVKDMSRRLVANE